MVAFIMLDKDACFRVILVLLLANSSRKVCDRSESNFTPLRLCMASSAASRVRNLQKATGCRSKRSGNETVKNIGKEQRREITHNGPEVRQMHPLGSGGIVPPNVKQISAMIQCCHFLL